MGEHLGISSSMNIPFIIAEAGSCHEETLGRATQLIRTAAQMGADCCKFQFWSSPTRMRARRGIPEPSGTYDTGSVREVWLPTLRDVCHKENILFGCSVYLPEDVATLSKYVDVWKVSSFEAKDRELTKLVSEARGERPWFLSTGMQGVEDDALLPKGAIYLHCVSAYPCPPEQANLGAIEPHEGYSDHTRMVLTGGFAVMAGADYLECHYRLDDTNINCPDYPVALTPAELGKYIYCARTAAAMRGDGDKKVMECEVENLKYRVIS